MVGSPPGPACGTDLDRRLGLQSEARADLGGGALADEHLPFLGGGHEPGGQVDLIAHDRVLVPLFRTDVPGKDAPGVDADPLLECEHTGRCLQFAKGGHGGLHFPGRAHGALRVVHVGAGRAKEGHDPVTDHIAVHLVDHSTVALDDGLHLGKVGVEDGRDLGDLGRPQRANDLLDAVKVAKSNRYRPELTPFTAGHACRVKTEQVEQTGRHKGQQRVETGHRLLDTRPQLIRIQGGQILFRIAG